MSKTTVIKKASLIPKKPATKQLVVTPADSDVEVEFDDETNELNNLDKHLLASLTDNLEPVDDATSISVSQPIIKKRVGGNARLRAVMSAAKSADEQTTDEERSVSSEISDDESKPTTRRVASKGKKTAVKTTSVKRGPGRPRKTQRKEPIPRKGISKNPQNPDSYVEFLYDQPVLMKKVFSNFKSLAASEIQILFRQKDVIFYAIDHHDKTKIRIRIDASKLNHYYCRGVLDIGISQKETEMLLNNIDKDYSSMVILSEVESSQKNLTIVFDNDIQIDELHRMELIASYNKMENESEFIDEDYAIKFQFPSKYFKKMISDIKSISSQLSITQEDNESPLVFEYIADNSKLQSKRTVKDGTKIKLESNLEEHESFRVDVCIDYLKPISASLIADEIYILVDENKLFMTKSYVDDGTIEIKTLTDIIDERPTDEDD